MKKITIFSICLLLFAPLYAELKVSYVSGSVEVFHGDAWKPAGIGMELSVKDKVKAGADGKAVLTMDGSTRIWLRQNSEMEINSTGKENYFGLLFGKMRAKVKNLSGKKFQVKTPVSVASIRGTDFVLSVEGVLAVLEGKVEFSDINMKELIEVAVNQLASIDAGGALTSRDMTPEELNELNGEWGEFDNDETKGNEQSGQQEAKKEEAKEDMKDLVNLRQELRDIIGEVKTEISVTRELTNEIKESDMSAGRTLRDVHGNLVRVEQHLLRPDDNTIQILNLTKRSDYIYGDRYGWGYHGPSGSRLDVVDIKIVMNIGLPEQITEWPKFISSKGDDMHPSSVEIKMTNQEDTLKNVGVWKLKGQADENGAALSEDRLVFNSYINDYRVDMHYDSTDRKNAGLTGERLDGIDADGSDTGDLWAWGKSPDIKIYNESNPSDFKYVRLWTEGYAINNSGNILNIDDFANSGENPFVVLKKIAGEQIIFCRNAADDTDFFTRGNLDLVTTPDLVLAVAQKLAGQVSELSKSTDE